MISSLQGEALRTLVDIARLAERFNMRSQSQVSHGLGIYIIHVYCLAVEAGFYSDVVKCLPVNPATWVQFPAEAGKIYSLYDNCAQRGA